MALLLADSFDTYTVGAATDPLVVGPWTGESRGLGASSSLTRFSYGNSLGFGNLNQSYIFKTFSSPTTNTVYYSGAILQNYSLAVGTDPYGYVAFLDGTTEQVSVIFVANGTVVCQRNGTTIATFPAAYSGLTWNHWQIKIVIDPAVGEIHIRKNGSSTDTFSATGLNTQATVNAYATQFKMGTIFPGNTYFDDVILLDDSGPTCNTWTGDRRMYLSMANGAGSANEFTSTVASVVYNSTANSGSTASGVIRYSPFSPSFTGSVSSVALSIRASATGNAVCAIYSDVSGAPNALLGTSDPIVDPTAINNVFTFSSPVAITSGTPYWFAIWTDVSLSADQTGLTGYTQVIAYTGTFPATASITNNLQNAHEGTISWAAVPNYSCNMQNPEDADLSYTSSSTVGQHDLFAAANLPVTPVSILAVQQRVIARKDDAGARELQTQLKSGATTVEGASTAISTTYTAMITNYEVDPDTSAEWTAGAVNALEIGYKVSV